MTSWLDDGGDFSELEGLEGPSFGPIAPIPKGDYHCEIVKVERNQIDNARATGESVKFQLRVIDGEYKRRVVFASHIVDYRSKIGEDEKAATTARIGRVQFSRLCMALGIKTQVQPLSQLEGKIVLAKVTIRKNGDREDNDVQTYERSSYFAPAPVRVASGGPSPWS
jgi:hypothetical protein